MPSVYSPYLEPLSPYALPFETFDSLIINAGVRFFWLRAHTCPCTFGGPVPGSPDPACLTCNGRGIYWDQPYGPFIALLTWTGFNPKPDEPGAGVQNVQGLVQQGEPTLSIPYTDSNSGSGSAVWSQSNVYDMFVEIDAVARFDAQLQVGVRQVVPYQQNVGIAASGAVSIYDQQTHLLVPVSGYTVSGASVFLPSGYVQGTNYIVEFTAAPAYVALNMSGGMPHMRPFAQITEPRRFRLQSLDLWSRARYAGEIPVGTI